MNYTKNFMKIFRGHDRAYGTYTIKKSMAHGDKVLGKGHTIHKPVTEEIWKDHLEGRKAIGIIPIRDDSTCFWGAIDIDIYKGLNIKKILSDINKNDLPLIPCRSKSGGLHCFCFVKEYVQASLMREKLSDFAALLGFGDSEIYPKQSEVLSERGDMGQWINIPYFNYKETDRYALKKTGKAMTIDEFLTVVNTIWLPKKEFEAFTINIVSTITDGPPCLQYLITKGFSPGTRNEGLFNIAVYLKKSVNNWEDVVDDYNEKYIDPSLHSNEVLAIIKSVRRKDYNYTCEKSPFKNHCNISLCRSREHGVGHLTGMPQLTSLTKYDSRPPVWFIDVEGGGRLELTTEELQSQQRFQKRCMEVLNQMPPTVKMNIWTSMIQILLESVTIIEAPADASPKGLFFEYVERFCTSRAQAREKDEILLGKPWTHKNNHYFRIADLMSYLERIRFKDYKVNKICSILQERGGKSVFFNLKGKGLHVWEIPAFIVQNEEFDTPDIENNEAF